MARRRHTLGIRLVLVLAIPTLYLAFASFRAGDTGAGHADVRPFARKLFLIEFGEDALMGRLEFPYRGD